VSLWRPFRRPTAGSVVRCDLGGGNVILFTPRRLSGQQRAFLVSAAPMVERMTWLLGVCLDQPSPWDTRDARDLHLAVATSSDGVRAMRDLLLAVCRANGIHSTDLTNATTVQDRR
jgi:hypothetical protein